jgi:RNA polymerase sigma factor (sigma-70 family)
MNLRELFERQNKRVYRVAMLYLKNEADAEDAVQNVFLKYMKKGIVFESERQAFCSVIYRSFHKSTGKYCIYIIMRSIPSAICR